MNKDKQNLHHHLQELLAHRMRTACCSEVDEYLNAKDFTAKTTTAKTLLWSLVSPREQRQEHGQGHHFFQELFVAETVNEKMRRGV